MNEGICNIFFQMIAEILFLFSTDGTIIFGNKSAEEILGYPEGFAEVNIIDIIGKTLRKRNGKIEMIQGDMKMVSGEYYIPETVAYRKNQTICPVAVRLNLNENRHNYGICVLESLVSRKDAQRNTKKAQLTMEEASHLRNEFVANVTHELRTPVNGIMGFTESLLETELTKEQEEALHIIEHCCYNMSRIIDNLLDFSKLKSGKFTIEEKEFSFRRFMDKTMETNMAKINEKGLRLMVSISPDIPEYVIGDELRLGQVLNNLISNAVKFTSAGQITVDVTKTMEKQKSMELFFMVMDTGIGISEEEKDKLFQSFSQVDASITRRFGGTGLGLSITRQLVALMNGEIDVQSEKGKGSTFSFSVQVKKSDFQKAESKESTDDDEMLVGWYTYEGLGKVKVDNMDTSNMEELYQFGSQDNQREMHNALEKLIICIEMENWKKAESFAGVVKELIPKENTEIYRKAFRLELTIRKEDKEKALIQYEELKKAVFGYYLRLQ